MYRKSARRSSLFLLELMISILMFSVASAWCVRLFVTARSVVSETERQNRVQSMAAGYAELFLASEDFEAFLLGEGAEKEETGEGRSYLFYYDSDLNAWEDKENVYFADYSFKVLITESGDFEECSLIFWERVRGGECYRLDVEKYTGGEAVL